MTEESSTPEFPHVPSDSPDTNHPATPSEGIGGAALESTVHAPGTTFEPTAQTEHNLPSQPPNETAVAPESNGEQGEAAVISKMKANIQASGELSQEEKGQLAELVDSVNKEAPLDELDPEALRSQTEKLEQTMKDAIRALFIVSGYRKVIGSIAYSNRPLGLLTATQDGVGKYDLGRVIGEVNLQTLAIARRNIGVLLGTRMPEEGDFERTTPGPAWTGGGDMYFGRSNRPVAITDRSEVPAGGLGLAFREIRNINTVTDAVGRYTIVVDPPNWPPSSREARPEAA